MLYIMAMQAKKIIFLNQKGGVGKTTTAVNVGSALAREGYKVLLVDLDSQGNLSSSVSADTSKPGIYELLAGETDISAVQTTPVNDLYCLSGGINMAGLAIELVDEDNREFFLKNALAPLEESFDFIFADPPYALKELGDIPDLIFKKNLLKDRGLFVLEHGKEYDFSKHEHFLEHREYGSVNFSFFR